MALNWETLKAAQKEKEKKKTREKQQHQQEIVLLFWYHFAIYCLVKRIVLCIGTNG